MKTTTTPTRSPLGRTPAPLPDCRQCGFRSHLIRQDAIADALREYAAAWQGTLRDPALGDRRTGVPAWTPLECGCHVRDMCLLFHTRLDAILGQSGIAPIPALGATPGASEDRPDDTPHYRDEEPRHVAEELGRAAEALARRLARLTTDDWHRDDPRLGDPRLTVDFFTRHLLHDIVHDLAEAGHDAGADTARAENGGATHLRMRGFHG
ncbi:DinB family protein [Streptomyces cinerochromogenes]|uniref:DinB family protein n=1 Tax=Streptomyces cinerochromogenes TaxID=66422 RepID=A0ABW7BKV3_9ACTN